MLLPFFWLFLAFIGLLSASPLQAVVERAPGPVDNVQIGYRQAKPVEATSYKKNQNTLQLSTAPAKDRVDQIGYGIYMSPIPVGWYGEWNCAIFADSTAWNNVNKAWVPETFGPCGKPLFGKDTGAPNIPEYLTTLDPTWTLKNTVLISYISGYTPTNNHNGNIKIQIFIPAEMFGGSPPLMNSVVCADATTPAGEAFSKLETIDWQSFPNMKGNFPPAGS